MSLTACGWWVRCRKQRRMDKRKAREAERQKQQQQEVRGRPPSLFVLQISPAPSIAATLTLT